MPRSSLSHFLNSFAAGTRADTSRQSLLVSCFMPCEKDFGCVNSDIAEDIQTPCVINAYFQCTVRTKGGFAIKEICRS